MNPSSIDDQNTTASYYRDQDVYGTGLSTRSFMSAQWYEDIDLATGDLKNLKRNGKTSKESENAEIKRLVIGLM